MDKFARIIYDSIDQSIWDAFWKNTRGNVKNVVWNLWRDGAAVVEQPIMQALMKELID